MFCPSFPSVLDPNNPISTSHAELQPTVFRQDQQVKASPPPCGSLWFQPFFPQSIGHFWLPKSLDHIDPVPNKTHGSEKGKGNIPPQNMPVLVILNIEKEISPNIDRA
jgi:hypothetical protein